MCVCVFLIGGIEILHTGINALFLCDLVGSIGFFMNW